MGTDRQALMEFGNGAIVPASQSHVGSKEHRRPIDSGDDRAVEVAQHNPMSGQRIQAAQRTNEPTRAFRQLLLDEA